MPISGREAWRRRAHRASKNVWEGMRALRVQEFQFKRQDEKNTAIEAFGRVMYRATVDLLTDETGTAYVSSTHPLTSMSWVPFHDRGKKHNINTKRRPRSLFVLETTQEQQKRGAFTNKVRFHVEPCFQGTPISGYMGGTLQARVIRAVENGFPWRSWSLCALQPSMSLVLVDPFRRWFESDRSSTLNAIFRSKVFADLPLDLMKVIVALVRNSKFNERMDSFGIVDE